MEGELPEYSQDGPDTEPRDRSVYGTGKGPPLPFGFAQRHGIVIPVDRAGTEPVWPCYIRADTPPLALLEARRQVQRPLQLMILSPTAFAQQLVQTYQTENYQSEWTRLEAEGADLMRLAQAIPPTEDLLDPAHDAPVIRLINAILSQAIQAHASDIHMEPFAHQMRIRFRVDGVLQTVVTPDPRLGPLLVSRIKIMAQLDIAEKRLPQDGRIMLRLGGRSIDVRVSTWPAHHGERVVLRVLDQQQAQLDLGQIGMQPGVLHAIQQAIAKPHGMILVTGPTGSGKTTTLYAMLRAINQRGADRNILTVEDPIEYDLPGIGQMPVQPKIGLTFAKGLRSILRQDPDVVMVGEIRDQETAEVAVQASLTGHLVLSTVHTPSAVATMTRLQDMGVAPFLLASTLIGVLAQRLVRLLCAHCKVPDPDRPGVYRAQGCARCQGRGYRGRTGIYEWLPMAATVQAQIQKGPLEPIHVPQMQTLVQAGMALVNQGLTSREEVLRVTASGPETTEMDATGGFYGPDIPTTP